MFKEFDKEEIEEILRGFIDALTKISEGNISGPGGLEALSMSIAGEKIEHPLSEAVCDGACMISDSINNLADAIRELNERK